MLETRSNGSMLEELLKLQKESKPPSNVEVAEIPSPAETVEDLNTIVKSQYVKSLAASLGRGDVRGQVRALLKACMSRDLALSFSVSGLNNRRVKTKLVFKETACCKLIEQYVGSKEGLSRKQLFSEIGTVLKSAVDWEGHRGRRRREGLCVQDSSSAE